MYIIRPPPMSTRLAKDSARDVVASEQASAITVSNLTTTCFMVVRLSPSIHLLDVRQLPKITPLLGDAQSGPFSRGAVFGTGQQCADFVAEVGDYYVRGL